MTAGPDETQSVQHLVKSPFLGSWFWYHMQRILHLPNSIGTTGIHEGDGGANANYALAYLLIVTN